MRFDILDEYSTLVPFGLGVFDQNGVVDYPATATKAAKPGTIANCVSRLKIFFKICASVFGQMYRLRRMHAATHAPHQR
jgi:hypothetical protein